MANPLVHAVVFLAAVLVPGGLLVYFAWRAIAYRGGGGRDSDNPGPIDIPGEPPSPAAVRAAFELKFPKESLRARNRRRKLYRAQVIRHRNFKK